MKRELGFYSMGNGISVADRLHEESGDYVKVAHIGVDRKITFYKKRLEKQYIDEIQRYADNADPRVSYTQEDFVFRERPANVEEVKSVTKKCADGESTYATCPYCKKVQIVPHVVVALTPEDSQMECRFCEGVFFYEEDKQKEACNV